MDGRSEPLLKPVRALGPRPQTSALVLVVGGPITRADIERLCNCLSAMLEGNGAPLVICDVGEIGDPNIVTVDALARLQLTARRHGRQIRLRDACDELQKLLTLVGLSDVVPPTGGAQPGGKAEERKQVRRVEKRVDPGDAPG